jgi:hypothetical protein
VRTCPPLIAERLGEDMSRQLPIGICRPSPATSAEQQQDDLVRHPDHYNMHYLTAYLGAVIGGLSQRGMVIHAVERTLNPQSLGCSITFEPPHQPVGLSASERVVYHTSWDEKRGWCCQLLHVAKDQSRVRCYLGKPLVPAPERVVDFLAGLTRVQTPGSLALARPAACCRHTAQELADDLIRFTPTCTWIG